MSRGMNMMAAIGLAAAMSMGAPPATYSYTAPVQRDAVMPKKLPGKKREVHKRRNTTTLNPYRKRGSKLGRRLRRKFELGRNGAF